MRKVFNIALGLILLLTVNFSLGAQELKIGKGLGKGGNMRLPVRTEIVLRDIGNYYGKYRGPLRAQQEIAVSAARSLKTQLAFRQPSQHRMTWHQAAQEELRSLGVVTISPARAADVFSGKIPLSELSLKEQKEVLLSQFPAMMLESDFVPSGSLLREVVSEYRKQLLKEPTEAEKSDEVIYWAEQMSLITNLGFFGVVGDELFIMAAASREFPPQFQAITDITIVRALLNLGAKDALDDFVDMRLQETDKSGAPMLLPAVWKYAPKECLVPSIRIVPEENGAETFAAFTPYVQAVLGWMNSYNLLHFDPTHIMTNDFLSLRQGMMERLQDYTLAQMASRGEVRQALQHRVQRSYEDALQMTEAHWWPFVGGWFPLPSKTWVENWPYDGSLKAADLYPDASFFLTDDLLLDYMLVKHNLEFRKWLPKFYRYAEHWTKILPDLQAARQTFSHAPAEDMAWLARQIGNETQYMLLGNIGAIPYEDHITLFLRELRKQQPEREIIFLNWYAMYDGRKIESLLADGLEVKDEGLRLALLEEAERSLFREIVTSVQLEGPFREIDPASDPFMRTGNVSFPRLTNKEFSFSETIEGVRLNSQAFFKQIQQMRAQHPKALFVVAGPSRLMDYNAPYSLGGKLAGPGTYVAQIGEMNGSSESFFDQAMVGEDSLTEERVLQFKGTLPAFKGLPATTMSRVVGFDVRILVPSMGE